MLVGEDGVSSAEYLEYGVEAIANLFNLGVCEIMA